MELFLRIHIISFYVPVSKDMDRRSIWIGPFAVRSIRLPYTI